MYLRACTAYDSGIIIKIIPLIGKKEMPFKQIVVLLILIQRIASSLKTCTFKIVNPIWVLAEIKRFKEILGNGTAELVEKTESIKVIVEENNFRSQYINLANIRRLLIALKLDLCKGIIKSFIKFKKIFRENFIDVQEDINRRRLSWRNKSSYS